MHMDATDVNRSFSLDSGVSYSVNRPDSDLVTVAGIHAQMEASTSNVTHDFKCEQLSLGILCCDTRFFSDSYEKLLSDITTQVDKAGYSNIDVRCHIETFFKQEDIPIELPPQLQDVHGIISYLRQLNMCHKMDVDLLCELLSSIQLDNCVVAVYMSSLVCTDLVAFDEYMNTDVGHHLFGLMLTRHTAYHPSTFTIVCGIKDSLSHTFNIATHKFTVVRCQQVDLIIEFTWQFPQGYCRQILSSVNDNTVKESLMACSFISVELLVDGEWQMIYSGDSCARIHELSRQQSDIQGKLCINDTGHARTCWVYL